MDSITSWGVSQSFCLRGLPFKNWFEQAPSNLATADHWGIDHLAWNNSSHSLLVQLLPLFLLTGKFSNHCDRANCHTSSAEKNWSQRTPTSHSSLGRGFNWPNWGFYRSSLLRMVLCRKSYSECTLGVWFAFTGGYGNRPSGRLYSSGCHQTSLDSTRIHKHRCSGMGVTGFWGGWWLVHEAGHSHHNWICVGAESEEIKQLSNSNKNWQRCRSILFILLSAQLRLLILRTSFLITGLVDFGCRYFDSSSRCDCFQF